MARRAKTHRRGKVQKIITPYPSTGQPEKAEIAVEGAEPLYSEIRIDNALKTEDGKTHKLRKGEDVDVTIEADPTEK